jgi:hypothetical protein
MASAPLRELTASQRAAFVADMTAMIEADLEVSLFEWVLQRMVRRHLEPGPAAAAPPRVRHRALDRVRAECALLLSTLAHAGHDDAGAARSAFEIGRQRLGLPDLPLLDRGRCGLAELDRTLSALDTVTFELKRRTLQAAAACISTDGRVTVVEGEMLRGIADSLGCPMPPLLPGQRIV